MWLCPVCGSRLNHCRYALATTMPVVFLSSRCPTPDCLWPMRQIEVPEDRDDDWPEWEIWRLAMRSETMDYVVHPDEIGFI